MSLKQDCKRRDMNRNCLILKRDPSMRDIICFRFSECVLADITREQARTVS